MNGTRGWGALLVPWWRPAISALLITLIVGLLASTAGLRWGRPMAPEDPALALFGFNVCALPCWAGIDLGQTPFVAADELIETALDGIEHDVLVSGSQIAVLARHEQHQFSAQVHYNGGIAWAVRLRIRVPLLDLIGRLGFPDCALYNGSMSLVWLMVDNDTRLLLTATVTTATLDGTVEAMWITAADTTCGDFEARRWQGFAPAWRYAPPD